ncbi:hypothetical protein [Clostridium saccharobutylicum]|uniref:Tetratricopeptide repeat protein n=1 Tax=Clostridium saccharobutylicum TaxID=169679 RepID=A0A1S8N5L1_CLOSA|nr:hypothetical protein [Clostridium saccharobutylicum]OOM11705.1 hypothetical protein CLOSAC_21320 [Clostridium saccharobutylicum]
MKKEFEKKFFGREMEYMDLFEEGDIDGALKMIQETWDIFSEPKIDQDLFYILIEDLIKICTKSGRYELGNQYISLLFVSGMKRADYGEKELVAGILAYEQGKLEIAKEMFYIANYKSDGELFRNKENKKYKELIK